MVERVFVLMPAYNAAATIEAVFARVPPEALRRIERFVVVNDGSKDDTAGALARLEKRFQTLKVLTHPQNRGYGEAEKTLLRYAIAEGAQVGIVLHSDGQYSPEKIPDLLAPFDRDTADLVQGSRMLGGGALKGGMPLWRYIANRALTFVSNLLMGTKLSEFHSGYRAFSRALLERLPLDANSDDFVFDNQILAEVAWLFLPIGEVSCPTSYAPEASSISFWRSVRYGFGCLNTAISFRLARLGFATSTRFPKRA